MRWPIIQTYTPTKFVPDWSAIAGVGVIFNGLRRQVTLTKKAFVAGPTLDNTNPLNGAETEAVKEKYSNAAAKSEGVGVIVTAKKKSTAKKRGRPKKVNFDLILAELQTCPGIDDVKKLLRDRFSLSERSLWRSIKELRQKGLIHG